MAKRSQKEVNEFLSQFFSNPRKEGQKEDKLLYKNSVTHEQFQKKPLEKAGVLYNTPYEELAKGITQNQPKATMLSNTETQREFTKKRNLPNEQTLISDKHLWHDDRRSKLNYPGEKETETMKSYQRQPIVKSDFEYPNLYEHHFSIGSGMRKLQDKTHYNKEFSAPNHEGAISKPSNDLIPKNQQLIPKTGTSQSHYQMEYERKPSNIAPIPVHNKVTNDNWPRYGNIPRKSHYAEQFSSVE